MRRLLALLLLLPTAPAAFAAESYDSCAGFIDNLPATISTQGTWCLRKDLVTSMASGSAITIATNNVTIDCNGFKVGGLGAGATSQAAGVAAANRLNATVRNCALRGFRTGVHLSGAATGGHLVEDNRMDQMLSTAIRVEGEGNLIQRNRIFDTGQAGGYPDAIFASADIRDNTIDGMVGEMARGILVQGLGTEISGNRVRNLAATFAYGIYLVGQKQVAVDNRLLSIPGGTAFGNGVFSGTPGSVCRDNLVSGFSEGLGTCEDGGGNVVH